MCYDDKIHVKHDRRKLKKKIITFYVSNVTENSELRLFHK